MREIKFRAWDNEDEIMYEGVSLKELVHWEEYELDSVDGEYSLPRNDIDFDDIIWLEYTGFHDKNGKEIYEGDILGNKEVHGDNFYCVVEYGTDGFNGITEPFRNHCRPLHNMMIDDGAEYNEVIGNIYENPELLSNLKEEKMKKDKLIFNDDIAIDLEFGNAVAYIALNEECGQKYELQNANKGFNVYTRGI